MPDRPQSEPLEPAPLALWAAVFLAWLLHVAAFTALGYWIAQWWPKL